MADEILKVDHVSIGFSEKRRMPWEKAKRTEVLKDVSFSMKKGEVLALAGESGCGKSTLAKVILGLQKPDAGTVQHFGNRPQMVFQDPAGSLNPARTIGWILEEPLRLRGIRDRTERRQLVKEMLENVGLDESFAARHPRELSGGQKQRISIGVALLMDPRLVIADEPVSALDVTVQSQILNLLLKLHAEKQMTILFISHDLNAISRVADRIVVLNQGRVVDEGDFQHILHHAQDLYTRLLVEKRADVMRRYRQVLAGKEQSYA